MSTRTKRQLTLLAGTVLLVGSARSARADYFFNFNTLAPSATQSDQSTAIANYMDGILGCPTGVNGCVTISGLDANGNPGSGAGFGVAVAQKYTGDLHVVGPGGVSLTLGNSDFATSNSASLNMSNGNVVYDSYLSNTADPIPTHNSPVQLSQGILITFSHGVSLTGKFSFDYQIFPDNGCPSLSNCPALPDLHFTANGSTPANTTWTALAPGGGNGSSLQSPLGTELAPQLIGVSGAITLTNATSLSFLDWPATIAVDNLNLVSTPEPAGQVFLLAGLALVALAGSRLRRGLAKS